MKTLFFIFCLCTCCAFAKTQTDIEFARVGDQVLTLDLYLPKVVNPPLLIYIHGGA
jgi:carboxylesterase type B